MLYYFLLNILIIARKDIVVAVYFFNRLYRRRPFSASARTCLPKFVRLWGRRPRYFIAQTAICGAVTSRTLLVFALDDYVVFLGIESHTIKLYTDIILILKVVLFLDFLFQTADGHDRIDAHLENFFGLLVE